MKSKKSIFVVLIIFMLVFIGSCDLMNPVSEEEAKEAFGVTYANYFGIILSYAFNGDVPEGVTYSTSETGMIFTLNNYDVSEQDTVYTSISGTYSINTIGDTSANLTLDGGPVRKISYTVPADFADITSIEVNANGKTFIITDIE